MPQYSTQPRVESTARPNFEDTRDDERHASHQLFIGRQAIYGPTLDVYGYELLYRSAHIHHAYIEDGSLATSEVLLSGFIDIGLPRKVASLHEAVVYLGVDAVRRRAMLASLTSVDDKPRDLLITALGRARCCELLGAESRQANQHSCFTAGLFSALDALLDTPLVELLDNLPLSDELNAAILEHTGPVGEILKCTLAYEQCAGRR